MLKLGFIGAGNMGSAILRGLVAAQYISVDDTGMLLLFSIQRQLIFHFQIYSLSSIPCTLTIFFLTEGK